MSEDIKENPLAHISEHAGSQPYLPAVAFRASSGRRHVLLPLLAMVFVCARAGFAQAPQNAPSLETIRTKVLEANETQIQRQHNLCIYERAQRFRLTEHGLGSLGGGRRTFTSPALKSKIAITPGFRNGTAEVYTGWDDLPSIESQYPLERRIASASSDDPLASHGHGIPTFLSQYRTLSLRGVASDHGHRAYLLESEPSSTPLPAEASEADRCARGMRLLLFVDPETYFPFRVDILVTTAHVCSEDQYQVGQKRQLHYVKLERQVEGGSRSELWAFDQGVDTTGYSQSAGHITFPSGIISSGTGEELIKREWNFPMPFQGLDVQVTSRMENWKVCVTGVVILGEDDGSKDPASKIRTVEAPISDKPYFRIDDPEFPFLMQASEAHRAATAQGHSTRR